MNDSTESKTCHACAEIIKAKAKVCPYCRTLQHRFRFLLPDVLTALVGLMLLALTVAACLWLFPGLLDDGGSRFARHRGDLLVVNTKVERSTRYTNDFWLTGIVTNRGDYAWRIRRFEVRLADSSGSLRDAEHADAEEDIVVRPKQEHAFRVSFSDLAITNAPVAKLVRVELATDGNRQR